MGQTWIYSCEAADGKKKKPTPKPATVPEKTPIVLKIKKITTTFKFSPANLSIGGKKIKEEVIQDGEPWKRIGFNTVILVR